MNGEMSIPVEEKRVSKAVVPKPTESKSTKKALNFVDFLENLALSEKRFAKLRNLDAERERLRERRERER